MPWPHIDAGAKRFGRLAFAIGVLVVVQLSAPHADATDTQIGATVCSATPIQATITITQPTSDSVVNQAATRFRGTVESASQIEISIDGDYVDSIAVPANQTTFDTIVTLSAGTHTVSMKANEICGGIDGTDSVVLTYQPVEEPSTGTATPTEVDGTTTSDPQGAAADPKPNYIFSGIIENLPVVGSAVDATRNLLRAAGIETTLTAGSNGSAVVGLTRLIFMSAGLAAVVMAGSLAPLAVRTFPGIKQFFHASLRRTLLYTGWIIRGAGALLLVVVYFV